jgi:DNA-binding GntR family transcriptional regulator
MARARDWRCPDNAGASAAADAGSRSRRAPAGDGSPMARAAKVRGSGSLREDAYQKLLSAIIFGDIPPGSSLDEKQISEDFDLGIAVVRDALFRLSMEKLVERHARIGTLIPALGLREVQEVFEARILLEGACASLAAERASSTEISVLKSAFDGYRKVIAERDFRELVRMDQVFHRTIAAASRNSYMEHDLIVLHNNASRFWYFAIQRLQSKALQADIEAHIDVAQAIAERDAESAKRAMQGVLGHFPDHMGNLLIVPQIYEGNEATGKARPTARKPKRRAAAGA